MLSSVGSHSHGLTMPCLLGFHLQVGIFPPVGDSGTSLEFVFCECVARWTEKLGHVGLFPIQAWKTRDKQHTKYHFHKPKTILSLR